MIRTGRLVEGSETPVGDGLTAPTRAHVVVEDAILLCVVKRLPPDGVAAEAFCAVLLRGWGLPVPEPLLAATETGLAFASLDLEYPNLKQRLGWREGLPQPVQDAIGYAGAVIVSQWDDTGLALAADEAIGNADRNLGNILWDGTGHHWIDHERTLGRWPHMRNLLAEFAVLAGRATEVEQRAVAAALAMPPCPPGIAALGGLATSGYAQTVSNRLSGLATAVLKRFPKPADLLAGL